MNNLDHPHRSATGSIKATYQNFASYASWVQKLLGFSLYSAGGNRSWLDTKVFVFADSRGQLYGSLSREKVTEFQGPLSQRARHLLDLGRTSRGEALAPEIRKAVEDDLWALKQAGMCLDRLVEYES